MYEQNDIDQQHWLAPQHQPYYAMNNWYYSYGWVPYIYGDARSWDAYAYPYSNHPIRLIELKDYGPNPFVVNIEDATEQNQNFRTTLWTGKHLQATLMSINVGDDIGLEIHPDSDQFIRVEEGNGIVQMGDSRNNLDFVAEISDGSAIFIPAGKWHNIINRGNEPLKLYAIYAPPHHPFGTVHRTKAEAMAAR